MAGRLAGHQDAPGPGRARREPERGGTRPRPEARTQWRRVRGIVEETGQLRGSRVVGRSRGPGRAPVRVFRPGCRRPGGPARPGGARPSAGPARASGPSTARERRPRPGPGPGPGRLRPARGLRGPRQDGPPTGGRPGRSRPDRPRTTRPARLGRGRAAGGPARPRSLPPGSVPVAAQWSAGYGVIVDEGLVGDCDRLGRRACCTIHARTRPENMGCWMTRLSQRQVLAFHQDTPVPAEQPKESTPQIRVLNNPPPLGDRLPHTKRNRHRTQTPQSDSLNQTFTTVRETHFTPVSPAKECRWLGQLWSA